MTPAPADEGALRVPRSSRLIAELGDAERLAAVWTLLAISLFFVSAIAVSALDIALHGAIAMTPLDVAAGLVVTVVAHEAMHWLGMLAAGGRPELSWTLRSSPPSIGTTCRGRRRRDATHVAMLAPFVVVDLIGLALLVTPLTAGVGLVVVVANTMGSVADLWRALLLVRLPRWVECEEWAGRTRVWAPIDHAAERLPARAPGSFEPPATARLVLDWFVWAIVACAATALLVWILGSIAGTVRVWQLTFASTQTDGAGRLVILNVWAALGLGVVAGTLLDVVVLGVWQALRSRKVGSAQALTAAQSRTAA